MAVSNKKRVFVSLDSNTLKALEYACDFTGFTKSTIIAQLIRQGINPYFNDEFMNYLNDDDDIDDSVNYDVLDYNLERSNEFKEILKSEKPLF